VFMLQLDSEFLRLDIQVLCSEEIKVCENVSCVVVHDPLKALTQIKSLPRQLNPGERYNKFLIQIWNIHTKIQRGEWFRASRLLGFARDQSLLPLIRYQYQQPLFEGHRKVEFILPKKVISELQKTYATSLTSPALIQALLSTITIFEYYWESHSSSVAPQNSNALLKVKEIILLQQHTLNKNDRG